MTVVANCFVEECEDIVYARGWCIYHYRQWYHHGDPLWYRPELGEIVPATIYVLLDPRDEIHWLNIRYVGLTTVPLSIRVVQHVSSAKTGRTQRVCEWVRELLADNLRPSIYAIEATDSLWATRVEQRWAKWLTSLGCSLLNGSSAGEFHRGSNGRGKSVCSVSDCDRFVHGNGLCSMHYKRWKATGDPLNNRYERRKIHTECQRGHPYDEENTGYCGGRRYCLQCSRDRYTPVKDCRNEDVA
jgi:hypothetical protein